VYFCPTLTTPDPINLASKETNELEVLVLEMCGIRIVKLYSKIIIT